MVAICMVEKRASNKYSFDRFYRKWSSWTKWLVTRKAKRFFKEKGSVWWRVARVKKGNEENWVILYCISHTIWVHIYTTAASCLHLLLNCITSNLLNHSNRRFWISSFIWCIRCNIWILFRPDIILCVESADVKIWEYSREKRNCAWLRKKRHLTQQIVNEELKLAHFKAVFDVYVYMSRRLYIG